MPAHRASRPPESLPSALDDRRRALGRLGEELAAAHLSARGFRILERNARTRAGEIDIIAFDGHTLVFAEVVAYCRPWSRSSSVCHSARSQTGGGGRVADARVGLPRSLRTDGRAARRAV